MSEDENKPLTGKGSGKGNRVAGKHNKGKSIKQGKGSKKTQFGQAGIIGGMTTAQRKKAVRNSDAAAKIRTKLFGSILKQIEAAEDDKKDIMVGLLVTPVVATMMENADRRVYGTPVATVNTQPVDTEPKGLSDFYAGFEDDETEDDEEQG